MANVRATLSPWQLLSDRCNADGGWGANDGAVSNSECTALACLALETADDPGARAARDAGLRWLLERQDPAGAWPYSEQTPAAPWPTPIVLLALAGHDGAGDARARGFRWLIETRGRNFGLLARLRRLISGGEQDVVLDDGLDGWPWVPDTFSWVEPTSWALMAIYAEWPERPPRAARSRAGEAVAMLLDRECPGGGWNYGNTIVMNQELAPYPDTTALALLALRDRDTPAVARGFDALAGLLGEHASLLAISLSLLARRAWRRDLDDLPDRLEARLAITHPPDHRSLALAGIAMAPRIPWLGVTDHA